MRHTAEPPSSRKVRPHPDYPSEEGRYLRGNDFSPVAVAVVLNTDEDKIPAEIEALVRAGVESGAALSGTVQTPNIGFEKLIWNIVGNPNIRYLVLAGPESEGHRTGEALKALFANGIDEKGRVIGTEAANAVLYNVAREVVARFLDQLTLVDCQFLDVPTLRAAIRACYQETPTEFRGQLLCDPGAYPADPIGGNLTWKVTQPWAVPADEKEAAAKERALALIERLRQRSAQRAAGESQPSAGDGDGNERNGSER
ncbi:MAG: tetrahydromethanopterin S-methyltransferase subunit A [Methanospirillum sp.]